MKTEIRIIEYKSADYIKSVELRHKVLRKPLGLVFTEEFLLQDKEQINIGYFENDEILGILLLKIIDSKTLKMRQVAVSDKMQGKGIGRKLVNFAENWAIKNKYKIIELNARVASIEFYLKVDYEIVSDEFIEVGIPHRKMMKIL